MDATVVVALVAAVGAPLIAYVTASRRLSGKIGTSEASTLWAESTKIRVEYLAQLNESNKRIAGCETRIAQLEALNNDLLRENATLTERVRVLERENAELRAQVSELQEHQGGSHGP